MPFNGVWEIRWGAAGEHSLRLEPFALISVPPGIMRKEGWDLGDDGDPVVDDQTFHV